MQSTAIEVDDLHKSYDGQLALHGRSFAVAAPAGSASDCSSLWQLIERSHARGTAVVALSERRDRAAGRW